MRRLGTVGGLGMASLLAAWPARADEVAAPDSIVLKLVAGLAVLAAVVATVAWVRARDRAWRSERERQDAVQAAALLAERFGSVPAAGFFWRKSDAAPAAVGTGLVLNGDSANATDLSDLAEAFSEADFANLSEGVAALHKSRRMFEAELAAIDGRRFRAVGRPLEGGSALWLFDVGDVAQRLAECERLVRERTAFVDTLTGCLEALPVPVWRRTREGRIDWCNSAYARVIDAPSAAAAARLGRELETALTQGQARQLAEQARDEGEPARETRFVVIDGQRRALEITELPPLADGSQVGVALDVTDREDARGEVKRHLDAQAEILNNLNTAIAIYGADKRLAYFNTAYARLWRLDEAFLDTGPHLFEVFDLMREARLLPEEADYPAFKRRMGAMFTDLLQTEETLLYRPDATVLRQVISPHPLGGLLYFYEDVTDRLALEQSYNTLLDVQRETLDNMHEGVALYGADGRLKLFNPAFAQIWQLEAKDLEGEPHIADLVDLSRDFFGDQHEWQSLRDHLIAMTTDRKDRSGRMERDDGVVLDFAGVALPDGNTLYTYADVTDSANIERALRERNEALQTADRLKSEFIANVSYELRTPLNVIMGFAEVMAAELFGKLNQKQGEYVSGILDSSRQLLALINDILDLAMVEAGRLDLDVRRFDLRALLESVASLAREQVRESGHRLTFDCPADIGSLEGDERRIKQALFNLLSNAIKYTPPDGKITLGASREDDGIRLWVSDTGIGIDETEREAVFEKFRRGSGAAWGQGAGLGLSLVKSFVQLHGGWVELSSEPGEGTRVTCVFPPRRIIERRRAEVAGFAGDGAEA